MPVDFSKIVKLDFPANQYYKQKYDKTQLTIHHTVSGRGTSGDFRHWLNDPKRIATCVIVDYKGVINQLYWSGYWGHHLGVKSSFLKSRGIDNYRGQNLHLNRHSIGLEIDAWGGLKKKDGKWYTYTGKVLDNSRVIEVPNGYRGYDAFERYTDDQIRQVENLALLWHDKYGIPLHYNEDMWDVSNDALNGKSGIYSHSSYRSDKSDIFPQNELIECLKSLSVHI